MISKETKERMAWKFQDFVMHELVEIEGDFWLIFYDEDQSIDEKIKCEFEFGDDDFSYLAEVEKIEEILYAHPDVSWFMFGESETITRIFELERKEGEKEYHFLKE